MVNRKPSKSPKPRIPSESSEALDAVLNEDGDVARAISALHDRTVLWRLRTGQRKPELDTALELDQMSEGRIAVGGWKRPPRAVRRTGRIAAGAR